MKKSILYMALFSAASTAQAQTPQQIVQKFYPEYSRKYQCYQVNVKDNDQYYVRQTKSETCQTAQGKLMYLLFTGNAFNFEKGIADGTHVQPGPAGVSVLRQTGNGWELLAAQPRGWTDSFDNTPEAKSWSFHEFDKGKWEFLTLHGNVHGGYADSAYQLSVHDGAKGIIKGSIATEAENMGALGDCPESSYKGRKSTATERRRCLSEPYNLPSKIEILKDGRTSTGFYPLQLTVSGFDGPKKYTNKVFITTYNSAKRYYSTPKDYPLADKDF